MTKKDILHTCRKSEILLRAFEVNQIFYTVHILEGIVSYRLSEATLTSRSHQLS